MKTPIYRVIIIAIEVSAIGKSAQRRLVLNKVSWSGDNDIKVYINKLKA